MGARVVVGASAPRWRHPNATKYRKCVGASHPRPKFSSAQKSARARCGSRSRPTNEGARHAKRNLRKGAVPKPNRQPQRTARIDRRPARRVQIPGLRALLASQRWRRSLHAVHHRPIVRRLMPAQQVARLNQHRGPRETRAGQLVRGTHAHTRTHTRTRTHARQIGGQPTGTAHAQQHDS